MDCNAHKYCLLLLFVLPQVEETPKTKMIRAYVSLQEGDVLTGDQIIIDGIRTALNKCAPSR
jgi:hypothetical protein